MKNSGAALGLAILSLLLAACASAAPQPNQAVVATAVAATAVANQVAVQRAVAATLTAAAPATQATAPASTAGPATVSPPASTTADAGHTSDAAASSPASTTAATAEPICIVQTAGLNLRSGPGTVFAPPVGSLAASERLKPLAFVARGFPSGQWIEVQAGTQVGWVSAGQQAVTCNFDPATLPAGNIPPTPAPTATAILPTATTPPELAIAAVDIPVGGPSDVADLTLKVIIPAGLPPSSKPDVTSKGIAFHRQVVFQAQTRIKSAGPQDGAGIREVQFEIDDSGQAVYTRTERTAGFCAFGGGEPKCTVLIPAQSPHWPGTSTSIQLAHDYFAQITVTSKDGTQYGPWSFTFTIDQ
jgi:hypothetical protein